MTLKCKFKSNSPISADSCWVNVSIQCLALCRKCDIEIDFIICFCSHVMFSPARCVTVSSHNIWGEENKKWLRGKSWNYKAGVPWAKHKQFEFSASFEIFLKPSIFSGDKSLWTTTRFSMFFFVGWKIAHIAFHIFFLCFNNCKSWCVRVHQSSCQSLFQWKNEDDTKKCDGGSAIQGSICLAKILSLS